MDEELMQYLAYWDQAQKPGGSFEPAEQTPLLPASEVDQEDPYWAYLGQEEQMLTEDRTPNPVYPATTGKDSDDPPATWTNPDLLDEIDKLKRQLYDMECAMNTKEAGGGKWVTKAGKYVDEKTMARIRKLRERIDRISDSLGVKDEKPRSMYKTK